MVCEMVDWGGRDDRSIMAPRIGSTLIKIGVKSLKFSLRMGQDRTLHAISGECLGILL
jgi:hypothetical protein